MFEFITNQGNQPVLSEHTSFPVDPDNDTIENCIENVKNADLFVLILGNRYGYITDSGKSITNTEYQYAKRIGIPIYIFVYKALNTILPIWKANKDADFSSTVDSIKVFEFVEELRENNKSWCFEFEKAQDIILTLKIQFAHLFKQSLELRKKFKISDLPEFFKFLSPRATNIALKKELMFEPLFFIQVLKDEIEKHEDLKLDLEYKILTNCSREITDNVELVSWLSINFETILHLIASLNNLFNNAFKAFYGEPGIASDLKGLYYVGCGMGRIYKEILLWSINIKSTKVDDDFVSIRNSLSDFPMLCLEEIWSYPNIAIAEIQRGVDAYMQDSNQQINIEASMTLIVDDALVSHFTSEMQRISRNLR